MLPKDVLYDNVKRFVKTHKEDLNAFFTTSLRIHKFKISCCMGKHFSNLQFANPSFPVISESVATCVLVCYSRPPWSFFPERVEIKNWWLHRLNLHGDHLIQDSSQPEEHYHLSNNWYVTFLCTFQIWHFLDHNWNLKPSSHQSQLDHLKR